MTTTHQYPYNDLSTAHAHPYLLGVLLEQIGPPSGPVLDVGCGNGTLVRGLLGAGYDAYGVDASVSAIQLAKSVHPARFELLDLDEAPLRPVGQYSVVVSTEVIEHLYNPCSLLWFAKRALAPGGRLVLSTPYHGYLKNLALAVTGGMDAHFTALWPGGHIKFFSRRTLEQLLREEGFTPVAFAGAGRAPYLWKSMVVTAVRTMTGTMT